MFQALARCIGKRWKALPQEKRTKYEAQAKEEMKTYREKMDEYQQQVIRNTMKGSANMHVSTTISSDRDPSSLAMGPVSESLDEKPAAASWATAECWYGGCASC
mmetsp:Transcript_6988/g.19603  ORF Transcript_6988/g.19603 Transcript_6988/m.19603 type:complete len:104 (+) Transcript_6988:629-940(+)